MANLQPLNHPDFVSFQPLCRSTSSQNPHHRHYRQLLVNFKLILLWTYLGLWRCLILMQSSTLIPIKIGEVFVKLEMEMRAAAEDRYIYMISILDTSLLKTVHDLRVTSSQVISPRILELGPLQYEIVSLTCKVPSVDKERKFLLV